MCIINILIMHLNYDHASDRLASMKQRHFGAL